MHEPIIRWQKTKNWNGAFAIYRHADRSITIFKYWWMPAWAYRRFVVPHELGHYYGIPASGCVAGRRWCVMAEETQVGHRDGTAVGKLLLLPFQLLWGWGRYCRDCAAVIKSAELSNEC